MARIVETQPEKRCPKCGSVIPANGFQGSTFRKTAALICETCARAALPPPAPKPRLRRGEVHQDQAPLCEKPELRYAWGSTEEKERYSD